MKKEVMYGVARATGEFPIAMDNLFSSTKEALEYATDHAQNYDEECTVVQMTTLYHIEPPVTPPATVTKLK